MVTLVTQKKVDDTEQILQFSSQLECNCHQTTVCACVATAYNISVKGLKKNK